MARILELLENAEKAGKAIALWAKEKEMIHREVMAELKGVALTNKTKDKVEQEDVFNSQMWCDSKLLGGQEIGRPEPKKKKKRWSYGEDLAGLK